jgi:hypothetical protein
MVEGVWEWQRRVAPALQLNTPSTGSASVRENANGMHGAVAVCQQWRGELAGFETNV